MYTNHHNRTHLLEHEKDHQGAKRDRNAIHRFDVRLPSLVSMRHHALSLNAARHYLRRFQSINLPPRGRHTGASGKWPSRFIGSIAMDCRRYNASALSCSQWEHFVGLPQNGGVSLCTRTRTITAVQVIDISSC